ncbi:hypothetical protein [Dawidia soli]|uniref:Uncharacterized protein n=1 Tax=Dawidia soli TaxID=2782352 RepID=A0AAP2DBW7_9BACT|nr:hypothetical protein [Dawidia soli]MBT1688271.1 hypothetical protein [Dawidia soli]
MDVKIHHIEQLLAALARKTNRPQDTKGFEEISDMIDDVAISGRYLYKYLFLRAKEARKTNVRVLSYKPPKLDKLAGFLIPGITFLEWCDRVDRPLDNELVSCTGNYYCYVRRNAEEGTLMRSPVQIFERDNGVHFKLRGPRWTYEGAALLKNGCLFILMHASGGKEIHHVYKLGKREKPQVLQGVFSGVSTVFEPIAGRTVLIRTEEDFTKLKNLELDIAGMKRSQDKEQRRLAEYFMAYKDNNLKINPVTTFTLDDLGKVK